MLTRPFIRMLPLQGRLVLPAMQHSGSSEEELASLTVVTLKKRLRELGRPVSGKKADLIARLTAPAAASPPSSSSPRASRAASSARSIIPMDPTPRRPEGQPAKSLRAASWNVAGLRGLLKREEGRATLRRLVADEHVGLLLLQETKLQESQVTEVELLGLQPYAPSLQPYDSQVAEVEVELLGLLGGAAEWHVGWSCSTERKGYAGVATAWRRGLYPEATCAPLRVDGSHEAGREGRTLAWRLPLPRGAERGDNVANRLSVVNVYTPNAGATLLRHGYRVHPTDGWDARFRAAVRTEGGDTGVGGGGAIMGQHVCVGGDLNVAMEDVDFYNPSAAHVKKQARLTLASHPSHPRGGANTRDCSL